MSEQAHAMKTARKAKRMTQMHLADAAGVSVRTVIRAEAGEAVQDESLRSLCSVLGLDAESLTRRKPPSIHGPDIASAPPAGASLLGLEAFRPSSQSASTPGMEAGRGSWRR